MKIKAVVISCSSLLLLPFCLTCLSSSAVLAQAISVNGGSIQGTITDNTGAALVGATVIISSPDTGYSHTLQTDRSGFYSLGPLTPGSYILDVTAPSFQKLRVQTVIRTGTATPGSEKLTVGSETQTVEVNAGSLQVNTDQIGVAGVITQQQIDTLPVNGRNVLDVAQLEPGTILQSGQTFDPTKAGYSALSVSGVGGRTTRILLDGQDITDETVGTTLFNVPEGPVEEVQLNRSTQDVSGEVTSTGQVLVTTRSGTNSFHGNLFYDFQDNNAGFAEVNGINSPFQRNQFGGYVGGPIIKDKLFFFGGAERVKQDEQDVAISPNSAFDDITAQYPAVPAPFRDTFSMGRLDYNAPHGMHLFARAVYSVNSDDATFGLAPYAVYSNRDNVPGIVGGADFATGRLTHSVRVGYEKFHNLLGDATAALGSSIYNPSTGPANQVSLNGDFNAGVNFLAPQATFQSDKQFRYDGTWTVGAHTLKFGGEVNRILNGGFAEFFGAALYTQVAVTPSLTAANCGGDPTMGPCPGDPYRGYIAQFYELGNGNSLFSERPGFNLPGGGDPSWRVASYVADTWKITPWATLTAGLRWSVDTDRANQDLSTPLCSSVTPSLQFPGCTGNTPLFDQFQAGLGSSTKQPYGNFGPQAGFVISPGAHKFSVRGGGGVFYENDIFNNTGNARTAEIQTPGPYQNAGAIFANQSSITLPGYGTVTNVNGIPLSTITSEPISQAAPLMNMLKTQYQAAVQGKSSSNPSYIGTGGLLRANNIYAGPYQTPYSIQLNGGVQRQFGKGLIISADFVHSGTLKVPLSIDTNRVGAARSLNTTAARNAINQTLIACGVATIDAAIASCPGLHPGGGGATIADFATPQTDMNGNLLDGGLDSSNASFGGYPASAQGLTPSTGAAFPGLNPNLGNGLFILPVGRSGYDAGQFVVQQQSSHPLPGIISTNLQLSYTLSRIVSTARPGGTSTNSSDQFFTGNPAWNFDNPDYVIGRNTLDHTNELSLGGSIRFKYGIQTGFIGHFYSAPPTSLTLDNTAGATGQIFQTDTQGDGSTGDLVPGTEPGYYEHQVKGAGLNGLIANYNATHAGQLTPAGQALVSAGLLTQAQMVALNAVQQSIAAAPTAPLQNAALRTFDLNASYPIQLAKFREGLTLTPGVAMYNVLNMSNFNPFQNGTLLNSADAGTVGYLNGPNTQEVLNSNRIVRNSGTFDQGGPRTTEFQLKLNF